MNSTLQSLLKANCATLLLPQVYTPVGFTTQLFLCVSSISREILLQLDTEGKTPFDLILEFLEKLFPSFYKNFQKKIPKHFEEIVSAYLKENYKRIPDCFQKNCPEKINSSIIYDREFCAVNETIESSFWESLRGSKKVVHLPGELIDPPEILRFREDDEREKLLFVSGKEDHNGALSPKFIASHLLQLSVEYDIKYAVVERVEQICDLIQSAKKTGKLTSIIINAHGSPFFISFDVDKGLIYNSHYGIDSHSPLYCFSGLKPYGKITLLSCSTGKGESTFFWENIAKRLARETRRTVLAPTEPIAGSLLDFSRLKPVSFFHPIYDFKNKKIINQTHNVFRTFYPLPSRCSYFNTKEVHPLESLANTVIQKEIQASFIKPIQIKYPGHNVFLKTCLGDPREKLLFFSGNFTAIDKGVFHNTPSQFHPEKLKKVMAPLAETYDFRYKVVSEPAQICNEIESISKHIPIAGIFIQSGDDFKYPMLLSSERNPNHYLSKASDVTRLSYCINRVKENGFISFLGSSLGNAKMPPEDRIQWKIINSLKEKLGVQSVEESIARNIAFLSRRNIFVTNGAVSSSSIVLTSRDPIKLNVTSSYFSSPHEYQEFKP